MYLSLQSMDAKHDILLQVTCSKLISAFYRVHVYSYFTRKSENSCKNEMWLLTYLVTEGYSCCHWKTLVTVVINMLVICHSFTDLFYNSCFFLNWLAFCHQCIKLIFKILSEMQTYSKIMLEFFFLRFSIFFLFPSLFDKFFHWCNI